MNKVLQKAKSPKTLKQEGFHAYHKKQNNCPYPEGSREHKYWLLGFENAFTSECFEGMDKN
jgi:hypothetical protein